MVIGQDICDKIALIHKNELKGKGFFSRCSIKFISFFYKEISKERSTIIVYEKNTKDAITGFAFFSTNLEYNIVFFRKNLFRCLLFPSIYLPLASHVFQRLFNYTKIDYCTELVQIAVDSSFKGQGVALKLIQLAEKALMDMGINSYFLQVHNNNLSAIKFYEKNGFIMVKDLKNKKIFKKEISY